jgi:hypothetical protein
LTSTSCMGIKLDAFCRSALRKEQIDPFVCCEDRLCNDRPQERLSSSRRKNNAAQPYPTPGNIICGAGNTVHLAFCLRHGPCTGWVDYIFLGGAERIVRGDTRSWRLNRSLHSSRTGRIQRNQRRRYA